MAITTLAPTVDANGISAPSFAEILASLQEQYRGIFGSDVYLGNDSQDGQFLGIIATAINDVNAAAVAIYNAYSPATAVGAGLASVVKINGIAKGVATSSSVDLRIVGQAGTVITNGVAIDTNNNRWSLPASVLIPSEGEITVTATCQTAGAIAAPVGTVNRVGTPTLGWQTVSNASAAAVGAPVESDAQLRVRQKLSTAIPSKTVLEGTVGAVAALDGVTRYTAFENDTGSVDENGIPAHSISLVVEGGDAHAIATAIAKKKTPGTQTYGTTTEIIVDAYGIARPINFFRPTYAAIHAAITLRSMVGYTSLIGAQIQARVAAYIQGLAIGQDVLLTRLYVPANLGGGTGAETFEIESLLIARGSGTPASSDIAIAFNETAICNPADIVLTVT